MALLEPNIDAGAYRSMGVGQRRPLPFPHPKAKGRTGTYFISKNKPLTGRPIIVALHGYKSLGAQMVYMLESYVDRIGGALVAPDSANDRWSVPKASEMSDDAQHAVNALFWMRTHSGAVDLTRVCAVGHSFGTRMAAFLATNAKYFTRAALLHGRFVPESLGSNKAMALFTGSPKDDQFPFSVTQRQWVEWPGDSRLARFDGPDCKHRPQDAELRCVAKFVSE